MLLGPLEDELAQREDALPPARHARLETAYRNSLCMHKLVNTLLDFARIEADRVQAVYEPTDLALFTTHLAGNFRSVCEHAGLQLNAHCPSLPQPVYVDHEMWEKIVLNLLSNAFKFTFSGSITVNLAFTNEHVILKVEDTGTGITSDQLPKIFERFYCVKGARSRSYEGTGIGLSLVQELARLHGGSIHAESVYEHGSVFTVIISFGYAHLAPDRIGAGRAPVSTVLGSSPFVEEAQRWLPDSLPYLADDRPVSLQPRPRIVWADDNADMREYVRHLLSDHYEVEAVGDGAAALAAVRHSPPALVLSDVMMPELDGFGLLRELRADPHICTIPVILLSARAGQEACIAGVGRVQTIIWSSPSVPVSYSRVWMRMWNLRRYGAILKSAVMQLNRPKFWLQAMHGCKNPSSVCIT